MVRSWSILHPHEKTEYTVHGDYDILCHEDESEGWLRRSIDTIQAEVGTLVEILEVTRDGFETRTKYKLTHTGLERVPTK
jgi:hypothetical protein